MINIGGFVPPAVANTISVISCACLVWKINNLPSSIQKRLFPRQIRTLAISDVLFGVISLCRNILEYLGLFLTTFKVTWGCQVLMPVVFFATTASALSAVHLSMVFLFQAFKREQPLKILAKSLNLIWPISLAIAAVETLFFNYELNSKTGFCVPPGKSGLGLSDPIYIFLMLLSFLVCLAAGLAILLAARSEDSWPMFRGRSWRLALVYPLNFAITQGLIIFLQFYQWPDKSTPVLVAALTMQNLNGFVNTTTYLVQQLMVRRRLHRRSHRSSDVSRPRRPSHTETLEGGLDGRRSQNPTANFTSGGSLGTEASLGLQRPLQENFASAGAFTRSFTPLATALQHTQGSIDDNPADREVATEDLQALLRVERSWRTCWGLSKMDGATTALLICLGIVVGIWIGKDVSSQALTLGIVFLVTGCAVGYAVASVSICYQPREDPAVKVRRAVARRRLVHKLPRVAPHDSQGAESSGCPICLEEFEVADPSEQVLALPCFHQFHAACVEHWLKEKDMCPVCRHDIFTNSFVGREFCENEGR